MSEMAKKNCSDNKISIKRIFWGWLIDWLIDW